MRVWLRECVQKGISKLASNTKPDIQSLLPVQVPCAGSNTEKHHPAETNALLSWSNVL